MCGRGGCLLFDLLTIRGALSGHGIAMARSLLVRDYLERGNLVRLFDLSVSGVFSYYLGWRSDAVRKRFAGVRDWIIAGMAT